MNTKSIIKSFIGSNVGKVLGVVLFSLLAITFKILNPIFMKVILDYALLTNDITQFGPYVILFVGLLGFSTVFSLLFDAIRQMKIVNFGNEITSELRSKAFDTIMKTELYEINKISNDELSSSIVYSTHVIGNKYISSKLIKIFYHSLYLLTIVVTMCIFNLRFGILSIISLPFMYLCQKYLNRFQEKTRIAFDNKNDNHQYVIDDRLKQLKTIKTRNGIEKETDNYEKILIEGKKAYSRNINIEKFKDVLIPNIFLTLGWLILFIDTVILFYNVGTYQEFLASIGSVLGCMVLCPKLLREFKKVLDTYYTPIAFDEECSKLDKIYSTRLESKSESIPSLEEVQNLKFNSVSFDYSGYGLNDKVLLDRVDFEIKKGETLGIIGLPGSGKSTIVDLITKVIRPRQGNVSINNCDLNKLNTQYLRELVSYVSGDFQLMDDTIEKNITFPSKLDEYKYNEALNKCNLKDIIFALPDRDETNAREANFSQADIQKVALAHAFYKDSSIIILDDATSKLDPITEENIMKEFFKLKNKISILVTNRLNNIIKCDKVLILSNGKVSEYGKVNDLLNNKKSSLAKMVEDSHVNKAVV